jgi:large subunit ribosomal protein L13e
MRPHANRRYILYVTSAVYNRLATMVGKNNVLSNDHYSKGLFKHTKTWFNQPARANRRRQTRIAKAAAVFPRPTAGLLRPAVVPPTQRYNYKIRLGRGFTVEELKEAGIPIKKAQSIGIAVDTRRRNKSEESKATNVQRLKEFKSKLVVFPRTSKPKQGDATKADLKTAVQNTLREIIPLPKTVLPVSRAITAADKSAVSVYTTLRKVRVEKKLAGKRAKKAAEKQQA